MTSPSTTMPLPSSTNQAHSGFLPHFSPSTLALLGIMLVAALLNFANIEALGDGNTYYTAAVEAMLQSPSNFFFVAAEPGGSVTIDKPPLGLWLQAISAFFLGVNGFAVVLPQILAGIFSVPLLYVLVKRHFGTGAGLIAALVMAITPVSIAVQRNNTMDATLIFTLLLAAWAFLRATETGKTRWLLVGGTLIGLGFNIKMLQAFLPLPAFYGLYFLGAKVAWGRKIGQLVATSVVIGAVSLAWIIAVDLVPADQRPYIGSSETNSALELAIGYNGIQRLLGGQGGAPRNTSAGDGQFTPPTGANGQVPPSPPAGFTPPNGAGGGMFGNEIGSASPLRLFSQPLDNESAWLLPFGLFSFGLLVLANRPRLPLSVAHQGAMLWGGWLITEVVFFSAAQFFHAYYLAMLTPPLAALVGIGIMRLWHARERFGLLATGTLLGAATLTLAYQALIVLGYTTNAAWLLIPAVALGLGAAALIAIRFVPRLAGYAGIGLLAVVVAMTATPAAWAALNTFEPSVNGVLPAAYTGENDQAMGAPPPFAAGEGAPTAPRAGMGGQVDEALISYLEANTEGMRYMLAVASSQQGAGYVLATGRGVLYMGGFNGQDDVVSAEDLQALVEAGELRYVQYGGMPMGPGGMGGTKADIVDWLDASCTVVDDIQTSGATLYDCAS